MRKPSFFDTFSCRSGRHCRTCRSRQGGIAFREGIASHFGLPSGDWECPHGRPLGLGTSAQPLPLPPADRSAPATAGSLPAIAPDPATIAEAQRRFAICKACGYARDDAFACALHPDCCFGQFRSNLANHCRAGKW